MTASATNRAVLRVSPRSWWMEEALRVNPGKSCPPLRDTVDADVCVVGGGYMGLWTAYELTRREPSLHVVVLEADICGAGGSGANGGFFSSSWDRLDKLCHYFGEAEGIRYASALADEVGDLATWCARHNADIEFHHEGALYPVQAESWQAPVPHAALGLLAAHGLSDRMPVVDGATARRIADSPRFIAGVITPECATVQPGKLARELRRVLLERGVHIYEGTRLQELRQGVPVLVKTPSGLVRAKQVVLATGAWATPLRPLRRTFAVVTDYVAITEPIPELLNDIGWTSHMAIADSREMCYYFRRTEDGRVAIGGGTWGVVFGKRMCGGAFTSARLVDVAARGLAWFFPQLARVRFERAWCGPLDMAASRTPFFMTLNGGNVHAGLGFSGHGQTPTKLGGKTLASLALGANDEWSRMPVVGPFMSRVPPEPLRYPMLRVTQWALEGKDRDGERGRRPAAAKRFVAQALALYVDTRKPQRRAVAR